jgi:hypothetical protein
VVNGWTLAIRAADLDGDLLPEISFVQDFGPDRLTAQRRSPASSVCSAASNRARHFSRNLGHLPCKMAGVSSLNWSTLPCPRQNRYLHLHRSTHPRLLRWN